MTRPTAFTLVELLVVLAIIAVLFGMIMSFPSFHTKKAAVEGAAHELAGVIRSTRTLAMTRGAIYGITFHVQNAPGSSGRILNNRSGGHWYQVVGPTRLSQGTEFPRYPEATNGVYDTYHNGVYPTSTYTRAIRPWLEEVRASMIGERYRLPKGKVRFLALADQDNGNVDHEAQFQVRWPWSYPRPWFGFWDAKSKRLFPWGGYDTNFKDFRQIHAAIPRRVNANDWDSPLETGREQHSNNTPVSYSGFYYEGGDGPIAESRHPTDRLVWDDTNGDGLYTATTTGTFVADSGTKYTLWNSGDPRPLLNAEWLDCVIACLPDGTIRFDPWLQMRHALTDMRGQRDESSAYSNTSNWVIYARDAGKTKKSNVHEIGFSDMCNMQINSKLDSPTGYYEASHYDTRTGGFYITLAPDAGDDTDSFASAELALRSFMPCFRVFVAKTGEVRVIEVKSIQPSGTTFLSLATDPDTGATGPGNVWGPSFFYNNRQVSDPITEISSNTALRNSSYTGGTSWAAQTRPFYAYDGPRTANGRRIGLPATDFVTADMLANQKWWLNP